MRFRHPDGSTVHLAYCTNVHPAETLDGVLAQLRDHCEPVRKRLGRDRLGIGLWLANDAARSLTTDPVALRGLRAELDRRGLEVVTLNGFPYEGFGAEEVKYRVYQPDWADPERLTHTSDLARLLAALLPSDVTEGSVSTLPLAWRTAYDTPRADAARTALVTLAERLDALEELTGKSVRVGLEPEPGCVVETTADAIAPLTAVDRLDRIGLCLDTCHLATSFEDPQAALDGLTAAHIPVVKSQLSAALHAEHPRTPAVRTALAAFDEPRFLHQTRTVTEDGLHGTDDLGPALNGAGLPDATAWRAHFHVPLHAAPAAPLTSTLDVLKDTLARLVGGPHPLTRHLEVETYTWQALPPELRPRARPQLADGIAAELTLARDLLTDLGLKELP
ncbi:metabolite traffic protein EboE [Streptomyces sp. VRA16 Mangrove soil]|uniref:metabolite traffic protein EboE n=1 Tax=Streptomyces sp. VRA16 Mangrove soil TaxID=2817434 RepID=UPI001A9DA5A5|nr:metabolite traffic protein EboE [Streptomyces sp. VRA16 Mangrove soil]MBO1331015.1 metabolite traffic protein EboE [Streptomyces sp. VRA16 Mangrove soil]